MVDEIRFRRLIRRWLTPAGNKASVAVTTTATSVAVTFDRAEQDTVYGTLATPSWLTQCAVTTKTTSGCTISFSVAAPVGATVDLATFRSE